MLLRKFQWSIPSQTRWEMYVKQTLTQCQIGNLPWCSLHQCLTRTDIQKRQGITTRCLRRICWLIYTFWYIETASFLPATKNMQVLYSSNKNRRTFHTASWTMPFVECDVKVILWINKIESSVECSYYKMLIVSNAFHEIEHRYFQHLILSWHWDACEFWTDLFHIFCTFIFNEL